MRHLWLAACAAAMLTAAPANALDIRIDPAPLYVFDAAPDRGVYDLVLQNILVVNDSSRLVDIRGWRVELIAAGEVVAEARVPAASIARRAQRVAGLEQSGMLDHLDFQFHLSSTLHEGERLSADRELGPHEAYLNTSLYVASTALPDTARVVVEGAHGDLGSTTAPVSRYQSSVAYRAPVEGRWYVFASGDVAQHHRWVVSSEYALDLARLGPDLRSHVGDGTHLTDYVTYGQPVFAAAEGVVVAARGDRPDNEAMLRQPGEAFDAYSQRVAQGQQAILLQDGFEGAAGNYVLIRHASGEHSLYAHLRQGSVRVAAGQNVSAGAAIGEAGSSGNSTEPHLHFQVIDGPDLNAARGLPVIFSGLKDDWFSMQDRHLRAGDVIERE